MTKAISIVILLWSTLAFCLPEAIGQDTSHSFAAGSAAFEEGDYLRALSHFQAARDAGMQGPAVHYNIGVCHYKLGNYREAEAAFRLVADGYPAMRALAQYNLGLALDKQGRDADARSAFTQARDNSSDDGLTRLAAARLAGSGPVAARESPTWGSFVDVSIGHDDNVALLDDASLPAGQSVDSAFTELMAVVSSPASSATGFRFDANAYSIHYNDASQFDQNALGLRGTYRWRGDRWSADVGPHFAYSTVDGDGFEQRLGIGLSLRRNLTRNVSFGIRLAHDEIDDGDARFAFVEGSRELIGLTLDRRIANSRLTVGYDFESNDRADPSVSPTRNRLWVRYRYAVSADLAVDLQAAYRRSAYDELPITRDEGLVDLSFGFVRELARQWQLNAKYRWSDNDSDVPVFTYDRSRLALGLSKGF